MTETKTKPSTDNRTYPSAFYAAAGVGDLAYQQLRKLPEVADKLRGKAAELAGRAAELRGGAGAQAPQWKAKATEYGAKATEKAAELTAKVDPAQIRDSIVAGTQTAAEKATKFYDTLVARGEQAFGEQSEPTKPAAKPTAKPTTTASAQSPAPSTARTVTPGPTEIIPAAKPATKRQPRTK
jgi:hypothetical protein